MIGSLKKLLHQFMLFASPIVTIGFGLMIIGLGYLAAQASFYIGWTGVALLVAAFAVIGFIQGGIVAVMSLPMRLFSFFLGQKRKEKGPEEEGDAGHLLSIAVPLLLVLGVMIGIIHGMYSGLG